MLIAIIDDGINPSYLLPNSLKASISINEKLDVCDKCSISTISHGTICSAIIQKYAPKATFYSIKILNSTLHGTAKQLAKAIEICIRNGLKLIHISLGSSEPMDFAIIQNGISHALRRGFIVVAAQCNEFKYSSPSSLSSVISVQAIPSFKDVTFCKASKNLCNIDFLASSKHILSNLPIKERQTYFCNSFAAPLITSICHDILRKSPVRLTINELKRKISKLSSINFMVSNDHMASLYPDFVDKAVLISDNRDLDYSEFYFKVHLILDCTTIKTFSFSNRVYLVIKPHEKFDCNIISVLNNSIDKIAGILYLGKMNNEWKCFCAHGRFLYCDESNYIDYLSEIKTTMKNPLTHSLPIIYVVGKSQKTIRFSKLFSNIAFTCHYPNCVVSDISYSYCYGFEYCPPEFDREWLLTMQAFVRRPLSFIMFVTENRIKDHDNNYQIILDPNTNIFDPENNQLTLGIKNTEMQVKRAFEFLFL